MKSFSFGRVLTLGCLVALTLPIACGDDDDGTPSGNAGKGGSGGDAGAAGAAGAGGEGGMSMMPLPPGLSYKPSSVMCMAKACNSVPVAGVVQVDPCCTGEDVCGLNPGFFALTGHPFTTKCEPLHQPGNADASCSGAKGLIVNFGDTKVPLDELPGCCRDDGKCGVNLDVAKTGGNAIAGLGLGCIDAAPLTGKAETCTPGGGGEGGGGGAGGAPSGGAPAAGGAGAGGAG